MFYFTTVFLLLTTVIIVSLVRAAPATIADTDPCDARFYSSTSCYGTISAPRECKESKINLGKTNISTCTSISLFWSYPVENLTITIETPFTQKQQAYTISIDNESLKGAISHVYRIFNDQETEVTSTDTKLIQSSDTNYQVILKLHGPPSLFYYGVFINYDVASM